MVIAKSAKPPNTELNAIHPKGFFNTHCNMSNETAPNGGRTKAVQNSISLIINDDVDFWTSIGPINCNIA